MYDYSPSRPAVVPQLQRHIEEREELSRNVLGLPLDARRDLLNKLIWSLPRNEIALLSEKLIGILQRDIIGSLPPELAFLILAKLDFKDLLNCFLVCKTWRSICEEQALWALLCASNYPPIRPAHPTWSELSTTRSILSQAKNTHSDEYDEEEEYDDRFGYGFTDPLNFNISSLNGARANNSHGSGSGSGIDPLGMKGGLRRNVWERGITSETLPTHLQYISSPTININGSTIKETLPISLSHLAIPSIKPQVNFKHLYIIHKILEKRLITPRPLAIYNTSNPLYHQNTSASTVETRKSIFIPKPKTVDAVSSVKNGGLPGHSEAIYSLSLINHEMRINLMNPNENCAECNIHSTLSSPSTTATTASNYSNQSVFNTFTHFSPFTQPSSASPSIRLDGSNDISRTNELLMPGQKPRSIHPDDRQSASRFVQGKEWLLSGSRDKTLRLWLLSNTNGSDEPRVVKIFQGGHSGSVLTHSVVKIPILASTREKYTSKGYSPTKGVDGIQIVDRNTSEYKKRGKQERVVAVSGGSDGKVCLWDIGGNSSLPEKIIQGHQDSVLCVRANERYVVSCSKDKTIKLFDINTLKEKLVIGSTNGSPEPDDKLHRGAVNAVGLSEDYIISASGDKTLRIWSIHNGKLLFTIEAHSRGIASIDFSTSPTSCQPILEEGEIWKGSVLTGASDASIKIFHLIERYLPTSDPATSGLYETDGDFDNTKANRDTMDIDSPSPSSHPIQHVALQTTSENGKSVYLKEDKTMWAPCACLPGSSRSYETNSNTGEMGCRRCGNRGHSELVRTVHMGEKIVISGSYDSRVKVWDRKSGQYLYDLSTCNSSSNLISSAHTGRIFSVIGNKYKLISTGLDSRINIWNFANGLDTSFVEP